MRFPNSPPSHSLILVQCPLHAPPPLPPPRQVVTAGADATVRVWDAKSCDCTFVFRPPQATPAAEAPVVGVALNPQNVDQILVATRSPALFQMTLQGQVRPAGRGVSLPPGPLLMRPDAMLHPNAMLVSGCAT